MSKKYFAVQLLPSRPDFAQTMTDEERGIMMQHLAYWTDQMNKGNVVVFGPVLDPKGVYGLGIVSVDDETQLADLIDNDPAGKINRYEFYPMQAVVSGDKGNLAR